MAHAGDRIVLDRGRYSWKKYTDEIRVDAAGRRMDPFPGFPVDGRYEIDGARVSLFDAGDEGDVVTYLHREGARTRLLSADGYRYWQRPGELPPCTLAAVAGAGHDPD